jgi:hypothetical protein
LRKLKAKEPFALPSPSPLPGQPEHRWSNVTVHTGLPSPIRSGVDGLDGLDGVDSVDGVARLEGLDYGVVQPLLGVVRAENDDGNVSASLTQPLYYLGRMMVGGVPCVPHGAEAGGSTGWAAH